MNGEEEKCTQTFSSELLCLNDRLPTDLFVISLQQRERRERTPLLKIRPDFKHSCTHTHTHTHIQSDIMANICPYGRFTHAVVRGVPESFGKADGQDNKEKESVELAKAQRQFGVLTGALRQKVGLQLIEIPADQDLPESWRIEDVAVIQGDTALITRPFKQQRRTEVLYDQSVTPSIFFTSVNL